jgi:hypothetical protein
LLDVNATGQGRWRMTHVAAGKTFNFDTQVAMSANDAASFNATVTDRVGSRMFRVTDIVSIVAGSLTVREIFESMSGDGCRTEFNGSLRKQAR